MLIAQRSIVVRAPSLLRRVRTTAHRRVAVPSRAKSTVASDPPFDPTLWVKKAERFAAEQSKITELALEFLHKDAELKVKDKDAELAVAKKDLELAVAKKDNEVKDAQLEKKDAEAELKLVNHKYLQARGSMTSRGVLEYQLQGVAYDLSIQRRFNATQTCNEMDKALASASPNLPSGPWFQRLHSCYEQAKAAHPGAPLAGLSMGEAYRDLYGELSQEIHGSGWTGLNVKVLKSQLKPEHATLVECLVLNMGLQVDDS
eukprot:CAMPEP_0202808642 /NCGR_PEP_ID=MMETSP1389-20130828/1148_1 /ASSEMBLY_ACC=CAM_ASM_000865 /TAXON_ID=302021 /ORGANISM="Rhodomonas sp., Strain CCMP768" /LENGTH=258 /DNA_ID=CAMNT_0049479031 /DNA_START=39 /DNA_END=815 /DNA_ORIENTATION=+